jgi:hypothetical protein
VLPGAGCRGVSDGNGRIYMTLGNKTQKFLSHTSAEGWTWLADVPAPVSKGTDIAYIGGSIYLLNGSSGSFHRYGATGWADLGPLPGAGTLGWGEGSWLVYDGTQTLYAHRRAKKNAPYNEMWAFDLVSQSWGTAPLEGIPGSPALDGSAAALLDGAIYALTGNNTSEFWKCVPGTALVWTQLGDISAKVKDGGDICANENMLFAFSGMLTNQFWRYVRTTVGFFGEGASAKTAVLPTEFALSVAPNPMKLGAAIHYAVPVATNVSLKLYDITGALAKTVSNGRVQPGRYTANLSAKGLARGIYILKLQSDVCSLTRKVVIQ